MTCSSQSECFISAYHSYADKKNVYDIISRNNSWCSHNSPTILMIWVQISESKSSAKIVQTNKMKLKRRPRINVIKKFKSRATTQLWNKEFLLQVIWLVLNNQWIYHTREYSPTSQREVSLHGSTTDLLILLVRIQPNKYIY